MTLCDLVKVKVNQQNQAVDSISFARVLVDGYQGSLRHWLYTTMEAPNKVNKALGREHAIRKGSLKLISLQHPIGGNFHRRLYDLSTDLKEQHNLISDERYKLDVNDCLLYTSPSPRDYAASRMPSSA